MGKIGPFKISDELEKKFRAEIFRKYGGKKGNNTVALEQAVKYFLVLSPWEPITMSEEDSKFLERRIFGDDKTEEDVKVTKKVQGERVRKALEVFKIVLDLGLLKIE